MRQVYALLGLVERWGPPTVEATSTRALDAEAVIVAFIGRMIGRGAENHPLPSRGGGAPHVWWPVGLAADTSGLNAIAKL